MTEAQHRNTWYGETDPGIYRYFTIPVFYHTGIYPPKYPSAHISARLESARDTPSSSSLEGCVEVCEMVTVPSGFFCA